MILCTSAEMPSLARISAASRQKPTGLENDTRVMSVPRVYLKNICQIPSIYYDYLLLFCVTFSHNFSLSEREEEVLIHNVVFYSE